MPKLNAKVISGMSDAELEREAQRRRRLREAVPHAGQGARANLTVTKAARPKLTKELAQYYANLELKPGVQLAQVRESYERLIAKYAPERFEDDPEKAKGANQLRASFERAFEAITAFLQGEA